MSKQLHNGHAAQTGLLAAQLAAHGFTGAHAILEGPLGFWSGMCPDAHPERLLEDADGPWLIHATSFKPWAACRHTHPTIDAALELRERLLPSTLEHIMVRTYTDAIGMCDQPVPSTPLEARFSLQHAAAIALLRGRPTLEDFDPAALAAPEVAALRARVRLQPSEYHDQRYPARFGATLRVESRDGQVLEASVDDALGDPERPLDPTAIVEKTRTLLAAAGYAKTQAEELIAASLSLPMARGGAMPTAGLR